jgi:hypothetical protein
MFIVAAATSLAIDNGVVPLFPDFVKKTSEGIPYNYERIFFRVQTSPDTTNREYLYHEPFFHYKKIPYHPNMIIVGYFQSEKYFKHNKEHIINLFSPSDEIKDYLTHKYSDIINHPKSVAIHYRDYTAELPGEHVFIDAREDYYKKALSKFDSNSMLVVFTNNSKKCKKLFSKLNRKFTFIEGENYHHDFYLMSMCKHNIICNSSFSWWNYVSSRSNRSGYFVLECASHIWKNSAATFA